ncbi:pilus assembly protein PilP [Alkalilimnicola sp. S0819]|uniref:pilus assembly protein PilP n=1 Tax=Alkalilimnicola sp. S0819 TaxID=2613922 RepID=UPI0012629E37|nr:pilus assembly protein PilP [Alkalilimnicola sp. S0819]KAB7624409.1 pilus assembly protein PilP [Alkalilimnicola sp. S0819]MPQ16238.1 pilus assembly protein PilQ [Alkalilimnicola sp. S0819]
MKRLNARPLAALILSASLVGLAGCSQDMSDLQGEIARIKQRPAAPIEPVPEMPPFESYTYPERTADLRNPFAELRFGEAADGPAVADTSGPRPDPSRPREVLEEFPLDALRMVGTLQQDGMLWGLIRDPGGTIHRVQPGNHMGQNHGRIVALSDQKASLVELVPNGRGGWMEREASLAVKE